MVSAQVRHATTTTTSAHLFCHWAVLVTCCCCCVADSAANPFEPLQPTRAKTPEGEGAVRHLVIQVSSLPTVPLSSASSSIGSGDVVVSDKDEDHDRHTSDATSTLPMISLHSVHVTECSSKSSSSSPSIAAASSQSVTPHRLLTAASASSAAKSGEDNMSSSNNGNTTTPQCAAAPLPAFTPITPRSVEELCVEAPTEPVQAAQRCVQSIQQRTNIQLASIPLTSSGSGAASDDSIAVEATGGEICSVEVVYSFQQPASTTSNGIFHDASPDVAVSFIDSLEESLSDQPLQNTVSTQQTASTESPTGAPQHTQRHQRALSLDIHFHVGPATNRVPRQPTGIPWENHSTTPQKFVLSVNMTTRRTVTALCGGGPNPVPSPTLTVFLRGPVARAQSRTCAQT
ncbi:Hypothetical protein, putative [Bodo saltans]|uniref:GPI-anchored surface protein n=1 Tax=Bodo saltans TaxID=75058 RepID=A0A0S4JRH4_BODSA|nr:Hypothetical protein, putative [Bodo saltans]|eukprot:CUG92802.1 Hypothetical protein, putative [Bodo saltans]